MRYASLLQAFCTSIVSMGCGASKSGGAGETEKEKEDGSKATKDARKQSIFVEIPEIKVISGNAVKLTSFPRVIFIFGGPGSGKGRIVASLRSMFGMKLISTESIVLKCLPKKVQHVMTISSTDEMAELVRKEPNHIQLEWVMRFVQHMVESDPNQTFIVDIVPNLKWLIRNEFLIKECSKEISKFEEKIPISFALYLSLSVDNLDKTLDYSHHKTTMPQGAKVNDEADNSRAKYRFKMQEKAVEPFLDYFRSSERLVTVDVSSGAMEPIWDKVHEVFTSMSLVAWRPVESVLIFAMEGLTVGNVDLSQIDMTVIVMKDITTDTSASVETLLEMLSKHIDTLADASHYFVIDPTDTTIMSANINGFSKRAIVFSDVREDDEGCVNKFSKRLNSMIGGRKPYFKAVCSSEDETLLFPASTNDLFCQQMALCMAEKHPSKR